MTALPATVFTDRFTRAVDKARIAHAAQVRKGITIQYRIHLRQQGRVTSLGGSAASIAFAGSQVTYSKRVKPCRATKAHT